MPHGHTILINYIKKTNLPTNGKTLIEIGSTREIFEGQNSTLHLAKYCNDVGIKFITVDMDPENTENATKVLAGINKNFQAINMKAEDFLKKYEGVIDYVYLDAFDFYHNNHSKKRIDKYKNILNTTITNENCWYMHLECSVHLKDKMSVNGIICFDDILNNTTFEGKGKLAIPYLLLNGYKIEQYIPQAIILKKYSE